jgi:hypothetical protein
MPEREKIEARGKRKPRRRKEPSQWDWEPYILLYRSETFLVGLDEELDVDWETSTEFDDKRDPGSVAKDAEIQSGVTELHALPVDRLGTRARIGFRRMLGQAVVLSFEDQHEAARSMLDTARQHHGELINAAVANDALLTGRYDSSVAQWSRTSFVLRSVQVCLGVAAIVTQLVAAAANFGSSEAWPAPVRAGFSIVAGIAVAILHGFSIGRKSDRYREASRLLQVSLDRFRADGASRRELIDAFEAAEQHIGSVEFSLSPALPSGRPPPRHPPEDSSRRADS